MSGEVVLLGANEVLGLLINVERHTTKAIVLGDDSLLLQYYYVIATGSLLHVPVGMNLLGRVVDALGYPIDGGEPIVAEEFNYVESKAPGIIPRKSVHQPLSTGILAIDAAISIGRGQRELIIGDRQTGKSTIAMDTIINHKNIIFDDEDKLYCIYVAVGQRQSATSTFIEQLKELDSFSHVTVVSASSSEPAALQYLAPYTGCTMG